jgi:hypothetical protein
MSYVTLQRIKMLYTDKNLSFLQSMPKARTKGMERFRIFPVAFLSVLCIFAIIAGCNLLPPPLPSATPTLTPPPTCIPTPNDFYSRNDGQNKDATGIADQIYVEFLKAYTNNDEGWMNRVRSQAQQFLSYETRRWTHIADENVDENNRMRIITTFISPELIRAVALNHAIFRINPNNNNIIQNLNEYTLQTLKKLDQRNDYMFLVIVQPETANNSAAEISLPAENLFLKGTSGVQIPKVRSDSFLNVPFEMSSGVHAGFIYFTFGQMERLQCQAVLDSQRDTSLTLVIKDAILGGPTKDLISEIPFLAPILTGGGTIPTPDLTLELRREEHLPLNEVPSISDTDTAYWDKLSRFVWFKLTLDNFSSP